MATYYLDFENGNDANNGTTFANRWKSLTNGATAARIAPGDTVRIMGSPAPTSLGQNGVWTSQALQATKTLTAATNATPIAITITGHGYSTGDTVVVTGVNGNTAANGTWEITVTDANTFTLDGSAGNGNRTAGGTVRLRNNTRVMLASAVTQNIASTGPGRAAWTAATANVSTLLQTGGTPPPKEQDYHEQITINTAFTTGKAAYYTLPSTLDLSGYQQISFWLGVSLLASSVAANSLELRLCSDTTGDTAVDTFTLPAIPGGARYMPVTLDKGSALGSSISSIALYVTTDLSTTENRTIFLNNIIACKASSAADSLTLTSLIGKNTTGETFWGIQSINGRRVMLDAETNATPTSTNVRGYYGTSETVTTWKRETIKLGPAASSSTALQTIQDSGTDGSPITFSGGWDRTNMSTQNLETWLDGVNGNGRALDIGSRSWNTVSNLSVVRAASGFITTGRSNSIQFKHFNNNASGGGSFSNTATANNTLSIEYGCANGADVIFESGSRLNRFVLGKIVSNGGSAVNSNTYGTVLSISAFDANALIANNGAAAFAVRGTQITGFTTSDNVSGLSADAYDYFLRNCQFNETTEVAITADLDTRVFSHDHDKTTGNHKIFISGALVSAATDQRHTASGISWKIQPTSTNRSSSWPVTLSLAKVACAANSLVTIKAWMRRDNTGLTMRLVCKGGQIAGVANDVVDAMTASANTWAEQTITFTPTEVGVVEITAEAWGGTTFSGWVDDLTISQA